MTEYAPGTPSWVDLAAPDADAAIAFYGGLFGWGLTDPRPEFGGYRNFLDDGRMVAGLSPMGEVAAWTTYVSVADADEVAARITAGGGAVMFAPMAVGDLGRMAICADPEGVVFGLWEPAAMRGAEKVNAPVSLCWNELNARDIGAVIPFYEAVFDWSAQEMPMGEDFAYTIFNLGERGVAGGFSLPAETPPEITPCWLTWFAVVDRDVSFARAQELGATVRVPPMEVPGVGKMAVLVDPLGAPFGILQGESPGE